MLFKKFGNKNNKQEQAIFYVEERPRQSDEKINVAQAREQHNRPIVTLYSLSALYVIDAPTKPFCFPGKGITWKRIFLGIRSRTTLTFVSFGYFNFILEMDTDLCRFSNNQTSK